MYFTLCGTGLLFSCLVVINLAAKVHPAHVLHEDVHSVPLPSADVRHKRSVSLQQALKNLSTRKATLLILFLNKKSKNLNFHGMLH